MKIRTIAGKIAKRMQQAFRHNNVFCSVCNSHLPSFKPYGDPVRQNAICPNCASLERHRLIWKYVKEKSLFSGKPAFKVLHFAPERCLYSRLRAVRNVNYVGCDLFPESFKFDKDGLIKQVDITNIPFEDESFDVVICNHVLEHIPDDRRAMSELYRIMKKGSWGIFQVPIDYKRDVTYEDFNIVTPEARAVAFGQFDHVRWYGKDYQDRLRSVGFTVIEDEYVKGFSKAEILKFGFDPNEKIYFCTKA